MYDNRAATLFAKYGGGNWPGILLPDGMDSTLPLGGFGYGKVLVDEQGIVRSINEFEFEQDIDELFLLGQLKAETKADCDEVGGYWYKGKAWRYFEEVEFTADEVDELVAKEMGLLRQSTAKVGQKSFSVKSVIYEEMRQEILLVVTCDDGSQVRVLCPQDELESGEAVAQAKYYLPLESKGKEQEYKLHGRGKLKVQVSDEGLVTVSGELRERRGDQEIYSVAVEVHEACFGVGASDLKVDGKSAYLSGVLGSMTFDQIKTLIAEHPEVRTIVLTQVEGSINDEINMHTGRIIRKAGLNTRVLAGSEVSSGGVDLFCAGLERSVEPGAKLGVHSWSDGVFDGMIYPQDHPAHQYQLEYFESMLGKVAGPNFYFYTLESASAKKIHIMTADEIASWKLATESAN